MKETVKQICANKKAYHDYFIEETYEAGIVLAGSEVKSLRLGNANLKDSYAVIKNSELWLYGFHISPYEKGSYFNPEPRRDRKLLMHKAEIRKLKAKIEQKGYTIVPTKLYFKQGLVKVEIGVAKGKELHDKRRSLEERQNKREMDRVIKTFNRNSTI